MRICRRIGFGILVLVALGARRAPAIVDGALDPSFGGGDGVVHFVVDPAAPFSASGVRSGANEEISIAGTMEFSGSSAEDFAACRLGSTGNVIDCTSFGFDFGDTNNDVCWGGLAEQVDGRRILVGSATGTPGDPEDRFAVLALEATNVVDAGFSGNGRKTINFAGRAEADAVAVRRNGDIVAVGSYDHEAEVAGAGFDCLVTRIHDDGTFDDTFDGNGEQDVGWDLGNDHDDFCTAVAVDPAGDLAIAGFAQRSGGQFDFAVARLTSAGQLDTGFSGNGKAVIAFDQGGSDDDYADAVAIDTSGRIVLAGLVSTAGDRRVGVVRLATDGTLDTSFNGTGKLSFNFSGTQDDILTVDALRLLPPPSNDLVIAGTYDPAGADPADGFVVLLHPDGTFDTSFSGNGKVAFDISGTSGYNITTAMTLQGGKILVVGAFGRLTPDAGKVWAVRIWRHDIFGDDFESADFRLWSNYADP